MTEEDLALLRKLGIIVQDLEYTHKPIPLHEIERYGLEDKVEVEVSGKFMIDESQFRPMCHLIRITDMICENRNPQVQEMYHQLVTLLFLTEKP